MQQGKLTLASGRTIHLERLNQSAVYAGLLEGLPTRTMNDETIEDMRAEVRERTAHDPFVIEPTQTPIAFDGKYPFGEPAKLPAIACVADFTSSGKDHAHTSYLTVIWFQDDYAFPLGPQIEAALLSLDWDRLAKQSEI